MLRTKKSIIYLYKPLRVFLSNKYFCIFIGLLGILKIQFLFNLRSFFLKKKFFFFLEKKDLFSFINILRKNIYGISRGWLLELELRGRGMNVFILNDDIKNLSSSLKLNIGFSHAISIKIPMNLIIRCSKTNIYIFSNCFSTLNSFGYCLRNLRRLDSYKGYGIKYKKEIVILKEGKKS